MPFLSLDLFMVLGVGLLAGVLGGVIGTGSAMLLMPVLVLHFGPRQAVAVMAIGSIFGNLGKVLAWRREVDWRACGAYGATAVPGAVLGVHSLLQWPHRVVEAALGLFFLSMLPLRRWLMRQAWRVRHHHLALMGAPVGFLTGLLVSTGPITVPVFTSLGLERGAFLGTEAAASVLVYLAKVATFQELGALPLQIILRGGVVGAALMAGAFLARHIVLRLSTARFHLLLDAVLLGSGLTLLWAALH